MEGSAVTGSAKVPDWGDRENQSFVLELESLTFVSRIHLNIQIGSVATS